MILINGTSFLSTSTNPSFLAKPLLIKKKRNQTFCLKLRISMKVFCFTKRRAGDGHWLETAKFTKAIFLFIWHETQFSSIHNYIKCHTNIVQYHLVKNIGNLKIYDKCIDA